MSKELELALELLREIRDTGECGIERWKKIDVFLASQTEQHPELEERPCYCDVHTSLQMVSGGAHPLGYLGCVTILIDGEYVEYVRAPKHPEQAKGAQGEREALLQEVIDGDAGEYVMGESWHSRARAALAKLAAMEKQEPVKLSDDVREFLKEWIGSAIEDDDHDFANELGTLLGPIYAAPVAQAGQVPVAFRLLNQLGEAITEWEDGAPPEKFADLCGNPVTDVRVQAAYAAPVVSAAHGEEI